MVKTWHCHCCSQGLIYGLGTKIPHHVAAKTNKQTKKKQNKKTINNKIMQLYKQHHNQVIEHFHNPICSFMPLVVNFLLSDYRLLK